MEKKNEIQRPDIMIYMSDQHGADYCSWGRTPVDTPVLDEMRKDGVSFEAAYTAWSAMRTCKNVYDVLSSSQPYRGL